MESLNVAAWLPCTEVEGPGRRAAVWLQGCDKRCKGCCHPEFLKFVERNIVPAQSVAQQILDAKRDFDIEGVTFLGGEPLLQAKGLGLVAEIVSSAGLSVMTFTGYTMSEIYAMNLPGVGRLLQHTDLLIDGPYEATSPDGDRNWVGSTNQSFVYLSDRYDATIEEAHSATREVEWRISADGLISANGWPCAVR
jgi:anaerobic ribonucleoside-triphosphate reductase activating protein